jgi:hypothetical protein
VAETAVKKTLMHWWSDGTSVSMLAEGMSRNKFFHILHFIFMCDLRDILVRLNTSIKAVLFMAWKVNLNFVNSVGLIPCLC